MEGQLSQDGAVLKVAVKTMKSESQQEKGPDSSSRASCNAPEVLGQPPLSKPRGPSLGEAPPPLSISSSPADGGFL